MDSLTLGSLTGRERRGLSLGLSGQDGTGEASFLLPPPSQDWLEAEGAAESHREAHVWSFTWPWGPGSSEEQPGPTKLGLQVTTCLSHIPQAMEREAGPCTLVTSGFRE